MKKLVVRKLLLALSLAGAFALTPSVSQATNRGDSHKGKQSKKHVPEFDGRASGAGIALVLGGVLVLVERRRRAKAAADETQKP
jgi:hypothetical protein